MIIEITFEQLRERLGLPEGAKIMLLRQEPEDVLEGKLCFVVEMPGVKHLPGEKLRRVPLGNGVEPPVLATAKGIVDNYHIAISGPVADVKFEPTFEMLKALYG